MTADFFFNEFYIPLCFSGQVFPLADTGNITLPTVHILDHRLGTIQHRGEWEFVRFLTANRVMGANGDLIQITKHIQLGKCDIGSCLDLNTVAGSHNVDGTDSTGTAGFRAVLKACFPKRFCLLSKHLTNKGTFAHTGGIGFHYADDLVDFGRGQPGSYRCVRGNRIGGCGIGIDAVVQIPQGTQLCFKKDVFPVCLSLSQERTCVTDEGLDFFTISVDPLPKFLNLYRFRTVDTDECKILPVKQIVQMLLKMLRVKQLASHDGLFLIFIGIEWGNALLGGAIFLVRKASFFQTIQFPVPRQQQRCPVADF